MRAFARRAVATALLPATRLYARCRPGIRILMYHRVDRAPTYDQLTVTPARFAGSSSTWPATAECSASPRRSRSSRSAGRRAMGWW